jgi:hypothetical protein
MAGHANVVMRLEIGDWRLEQNGVWKAPEGTMSSMSRHDLDMEGGKPFDRSREGRPRG